MIEAFLIWLSVWSPMLPAPQVDKALAPAVTIADQPAPIQGSGH